MKIQCVHAHPDDFEFVAAGTFARLKAERSAIGRVTVCTDGASGHHLLSRGETAGVRADEQARSLALAGLEGDWLRLPDGRIPREGCVEAGRELLAGLWRCIRAFEPDYLFCPPLPSDTLIGIHADHAAVADGVRKVAYLLNVPHVFTPEFPDLESAAVKPVATPVILLTHDAYSAGANAFDLAVDVTDQFDLVAEMSWAHQSQIVEWLPWVGRHGMIPPRSLAGWKDALRGRMLRRNREMGVEGPRLCEFFVVTAWGEIPEADKLMADIPGIDFDLGDWPALEKRLARWRGE